jgi:hypothetical protein
MKYLGSFYPEVIVNYSPSLVERATFVYFSVDHATLLPYSSSSTPEVDLP